jgi:hypothetical protein
MKKYNTAAAAKASSFIALAGFILFCSALFIENNSTLTMILGVNTILFGMMCGAIIKLDILAHAFLKSVDATIELSSSARKASELNKEHIAMLIKKAINEALEEAAEAEAEEDTKSGKRESYRHSAIKSMKDEFINESEERRIGTLVRMIEDKGLDEFTRESKHVFKGAELAMSEESDPKIKRDIQTFIDMLKADIPKAIEAHKTGSVTLKKVICMTDGTLASITKSVEAAIKAGRDSVTIKDAAGRDVDIPLDIAKSMLADVNETVNQRGSEAAVH